ncbi:universal stress protein UspA [Paramagnetospirillum marisnigri]|uniref:Universal stress protein UspA n=1 Tax=Paramagnetospirillum marisnigri TaxID=1285242 RepID=A0A178MM37_9PROT|nr:universal stress protein [Paramagnetospirillum marisnigri]OAN49802.1 universal stress protein UspA [Paramagnetospirillum marisnigri]
MSAFASILVPVSDADAAAEPLDLALSLAGRCGGHVVALHVRPDATTAVPLVGEGMSGAMVEEMIGMAETQAAARAKAARAAFDAALIRHGARLAETPPADGLTAEWIEQVGREDDLVAWRGRLADLVVFAHPGGNAEASSMITLNTALMAAGRPLLLCPAEKPRDRATTLPGKRVVIAWNGSAEAARAVGWAMPLLKGAEAVTILAASEHVDHKVEAPVGELAAYLGWHGITATVTLVQASSAQAGEELLRQAVKAEADLLVMGAYTHSRLRQLILGGVTRHVIAHSPLHVLMCH